MTRETIDYLFKGFMGLIGFIAGQISGAGAALQQQQSADLLIGIGVIVGIIYMIIELRSENDDATKAKNIFSAYGIFLGCVVAGAQIAR
ncbi:MAG: hypothetical protein F6K48_13825 [Okeania sp. SIO3H1]|uniref:hypothetical protein n=1 Tax=Okeania sp. SIO1I7 TaxID=2607772 RepID=UPI0013C6C080|nr:hypothetical protein [Okeania sp. SIO1I7]NEN89926.1 hypothetical protein [Okeania sp. SIO3H1]NET26425.1 hypothetical protein [Okeania sp. SIO1I7]